MLGICQSEQTLGLYDSLCISRHSRCRNNLTHQRSTPCLLVIIVSIVQWVFTITIMQGEL